MLHPNAVGAQGFASLAVGTNFSAAVGALALDRKVNVGLVTGWLSAGVIGFEVDVNHTFDMFTPRDPSIHVARDSRFTSAMANLVFHTRRVMGAASLRPYASGGLGVAVTKIDGPFPYEDIFDVNLKDPAVNVGVGAMYFFRQRLGMRADLRYISVISSRPERVGRATHLNVNELTLWRATVGAALQFP